MTALRVSAFAQNNDIRSRDVINLLLQAGGAAKNASNNLSEQEQEMVLDRLKLHVRAQVVAEKHQIELIDVLKAADEPRGDDLTLVIESDIVEALGLNTPEPSKSREVAKYFGAYDAVVRGVQRPSNKATKPDHDLTSKLQRIIDAFQAVPTPFIPEAKAKGKTMVTYKDPLRKLVREHIDPSYTGEYSMPYREFFEKKASSEGLPFLSPLLINWFARELMGYYNFHPVCQICEWSLNARVQDKAYKLLNGQYLLPLTKVAVKQGEAKKGKILFPTAHNLCRVIEKNQRDFMVKNQNLNPNDPELLQLREVGMKAMLLSILSEAKEHPEGRSLKLGDVLQRYIRIEEVQEGKVTNA